MDRYELKNRTKIFAHQCVKFASSLPKTKLGSHIECQLIRCATSVAVNYRSVLLAQSDAAFAAKLSIVIEEIDECDFWIEFALDEEIVSLEVVASLMKEAKELTAIFIAGRKTIQSEK
ncbi:four helix bundle protein [Maribellus comscasis]|uniref:four helix bundle protein n=1 Tax=Maribellus comscasis TaxID=2681766 RepID=UPI00131D1ADC|nr:four helix bundle protein [Maribellus comscasis]